MKLPKIKKRFWIPALASMVLGVFLCSIFYAPKSGPELVLSYDRSPLHSPTYEIAAPSKWETHTALHNQDALITGEVLSYEISAFDMSEKGISYSEPLVAFVVEVKETLFGEFKPGDKIYCCRPAVLYEGTVYLDERSMNHGGFFRVGEQVLLLCHETTAPDRYYPGLQHNYPICYSSPHGLNRNVDKTGALSTREGNIQAENAAFTQYDTVQELRDALPGLFETYREHYGEDHPGAPEMNVQPEN